jgi:hypothetical protein
MGEEVDRGRLGQDVDGVPEGPGPAMKICGIELESFSTTHRGKYVRQYRLKNPNYWRLLRNGDVIASSDQCRVLFSAAWHKPGMVDATYDDDGYYIHRRYVRAKARKK